MLLKQTSRNLLFFLLSTLAATCGMGQQTGSMMTGLYNTRFGYNLNEPEVITLPVFLNEISGISCQEKEDVVFAVDDEQGFLFRLTLQKDPVIEKWQVSRKNDYEGLAVVDKTVYLLNSSGMINYFQLKFPISHIEQVQVPLKGRNEFEILFKDPAAERLLMMCKSCKADKKGEVSVYAFDLATKRFAAQQSAVLKVSEIEGLLKEKVGQFKPSAANYHPLTGDIYIVSSINKLLVVTDRNFNVKEVHKLNAELFKQPEGLCFTPSGDLLISNEAAGRGNANILVFRQR